MHKRLINAGVARVVVATKDPDTRVNGKGLAQLRDAGILVEDGLLESEAVALNRGFFSRIRSGKPMLQPINDVAEMETPQDTTTDDSLDPEAPSAPGLPLPSEADAFFCSARNFTRHLPFAQVPRFFVVVADGTPPGRVIERAEQVGLDNVRLLLDTENGLQSWAVTGATRPKLLPSGTKPPSPVLPQISCAPWEAWASTT